MNEQYESIKGKLKKLLTLAERGVQGEAENARRLLEKLCKEYGISIDDILDENKVDYYIFDIGRNKMYENLFFHCYFKIANINRIAYKKVSRTSVAVEMTAMQYAELVSLFEWHKANFIKDLEDVKNNLLLAYCRKHHLYSDVESDNNRELTADEKRRLLKIMMMQESLNDNQYHKLLEQGGKQ